MSGEPLRELFALPESSPDAMSGDPLLACVEPEPETGFAFEEAEPHPMTRALVVVMRKTNERAIKISQNDADCDEKRTLKYETGLVDPTHNTPLFQRTRVEDYTPVSLLGCRP
jgi:hypothetical protein